MKYSFVVLTAVIVCALQASAQLRCHKCSGSSDCYALTTSRAPELCTNGDDVCVKDFSKDSNSQWQGERKCGKSSDFQGKKNKCVISDHFGEERITCLCNKEMKDSTKACNGANQAVQVSALALAFTAFFKYLF